MARGFFNCGYTVAAVCVVALLPVGCAEQDASERVSADGPIFVET